MQDSTNTFANYTDFQKFQIRYCSNFSLITWKWTKSSPDFSVTEAQALQYTSYFSFAPSLVPSKHALNLASISWFWASVKRFFQSPTTPKEKWNSLDCKDKGVSFETNKITSLVIFQDNPLKKDKIKNKKSVQRIHSAALLSVSLRECKQKWDIGSYWSALCYTQLQKSIKDYQQLWKELKKFKDVAFNCKRVVCHNQTLPWPAVYFWARFWRVGCLRYAGSIAVAWCMAKRHGLTCRASGFNKFSEVPRQPQRLFRKSKKKNLWRYFADQVPGPVVTEAKIKLFALIGACCIPQLNAVLPGRHFC